EVSIDWRVLGITGAVVVATAVFFGLAPLAQAISRNTHETLKAGAGRTSATLGAVMLRRGLVIVELSLALVLLISCGLILEAFWRLQAVNPGFDPANRLTMRIALPASQYSNEAAMSFLSRLEEKLAGIPAVISSSVMNGLPPQRPPNFNDTQIENFVPRPGGPVQNVDFYQTVGVRFFETLGARLVEGRFIDERDSQQAPPVVVINETMARTFWPGQSALGRRLRPTGLPDAPWRTIVGVVADMKNGGTDQPTGTEAFMPWRQLNGMRLVQVVLRTARAPESVASAARTTIAQLDPTLPVAAVRSMDEVVSQSQSRPRFLSVLLTFFTTVALALAAIGVYGVISYSVARRTAEFGIRMAVGADTSRILRMVLNQAALLGLIGVGIGVIAAFWLTRFMKSVLFATEPLDLPTFAATAAMLFVVTLLASWLPARRATRIDPNIALRYD